VVEVEAGLADANDLWVLGQVDELSDVDVGFAGGFMRMDAHRAIDVVVALGDPADAVELTDARADGQHGGDAGGARAPHHGIQLSILLLVVVEMAVAIDEDHDGAGAPASVST